METIKPDLASQIDAADDESLLDVVVELEAPSARAAVPTGDRAAVMAQMKETFRTTADPVIELIVAKGGEVLGEAWLNQTLRARVPARSVTELSSADGVTALDVPRQIEAEAG